MTKAEYIDFVRNSLPSVDQTSRFHQNQVAVAINVAVNQAFYDLYRENPRGFSKSMERYTSRTSGVPVNTTLAPRYTLTLSVDVVDLPRKTGGVLEVMQRDDNILTPEVETTTTEYVPITTMEGEQLYGAEASLSGNVKGFSWSGGREIEFWGISATEAVQGVVIRYIKQFKSYASTDNILLPFGKESIIIDKVREFLGATPPKDTLNDNSDINTNG